MHLPASLTCRLAALSFLASLLAGTPAQARLLVDEASHEESSEASYSEVDPLPVLPMRLEPAPARPFPKPPDAPMASGGWVAHGAFTLLPLGAVYGASQLRGEPLWVTALQTASGSLAASLPGKLLFMHPPDAGGRWAELDVAAFGVGLVTAPPLAALGTWSVGELVFTGSQDRGRAFLGALGGAATGTLLALAMHGLLEELGGNSPAGKQLRELLGVSLIGAGATVGYQWARGAPRR
jgi:hypothetical protein